MKNLFTNNLTCCLPVETKTREFHGRLKISLDLAHLGMPCLIGSRLGLLGVMKRYLPFLYIDKSIHRIELPIYERLVKCGGGLIGFDEEGGIVLEDYKTDFLVRHPVECLEIADFIFVWGQTQKQQLVANRSISDRKIVVTGNPKLDIMDEKFTSLYEPDCSNHRKKFGNYILVNSNFSGGNWIYGESHRLVLKKSVAQTYDLAYMNARDDYDSLIRYYFVEAVKGLSKSLPDTNIVFRPHPSEDDGIYIQQFKDYKNVHVKFEGDVKSWILGASLVIHHSCSTGIDAVVGGKPALSFLPINDPKFSPQLPVEISQKVYRLDELLDFTSQVIVNRKRYKPYTGEVKAKLKSYIDNVDYDSSERVATFIKKNEESLIRKIKSRFDQSEFNRITDFIPRVSLWKKSINRINLVMKGRLLERMRLRNNLERYNTRKFIGITLDEIKRDIEVMKNIDSKYNSIDFSQVNNNVFHISKKHTQY